MFIPALSLPSEPGVVTGMGQPVLSEYTSGGEVKSEGKIGGEGGESKENSGKQSSR